MADQFFKFTFKMNKGALLKKLDQVVDEKLLYDFQNEVVEGTIKKMIRSGLSPVRGFGRFVGYKNPKNYPGQHTELVAKKNGKNKVVKKFNKPVRPVTLELTGEMLTWFKTFRGKNTKSAAVLSVGISDSAPKFVKIKAKANNLGTEIKGKPAVPERRFIPQKDEQWAVSVIRTAKNLFTKRIEKLLSTNAK